MKAVDEAVEFADESPFPDLASLYDDVYVVGDQVRGGPGTPPTCARPTPTAARRSATPATSRASWPRPAPLHEEPEEDDVREARGRGEGG